MSDDLPRKSRSLFVEGAGLAMPADGRGTEAASPCPELFRQDCVEMLCSRTHCLQSAPILRDRGGPLLLELRGRRAVLKYYVYVDNL